ncbi:hypothetical protein [Mycobacterium noviomagense]|nr:hypothetical protein [Mycobacterium noviomagense]BBY08264.1 hypothetical protein MNVI_35820 [Mycobacterium noviomagense]
MTNAEALLMDHRDGTRSDRLDWAAVGWYVLGRRTLEGGYSFYRTPEWAVEEPNAPDTLAALESLRLLGIDIPAPAQTGDWLRCLQEDDGGYPTLTIGWATLRSLYVLAVEPVCSSERWLRGWVHVLGSRGRSRDWRAAIVDASHVLELLHLRHGTLSGPEHASMTALLHTAGAPNEGWARPGADLETTATAVRLAQLLNQRWHPDPQLTSFVSRCEDQQLGFGLAPNSRATSVGALWGGLVISRVLGQRVRYPDAVGQQLALLQRPDGGLGARHHAISTLQATWRGLQAARLLDGPEEKGPS